MGRRRNRHGGGRWGVGGVVSEKIVLFFYLAGGRYIVFPSAGAPGCPQRAGFGLGPPGPILARAGEKRPTRVAAGPFSPRRRKKMAGGGPVGGAAGDALTPAWTILPHNVHWSKIFLPKSGNNTYFKAGSLDVALHQVALIISITSRCKCGLLFCLKSVLFCACYVGEKIF